MQQLVLTEPLVRSLAMQVVGDREQLLKRLGFGRILRHELGQQRFVASGARLEAGEQQFGELLAAIGGWRRRVSHRGEARGTADEAPGQGWVAEDTTLPRRARSWRCRGRYPARSMPAAPSGFVVVGFRVTNQGPWACPGPDRFLDAHHHGPRPGWSHGPTTAR